MTRPSVLPSGSHLDVVEEHLEEAAFLYAQRQHLARTGRATWDRLSAIEARFEAHMEGLVVAGAEAWPVALRAATDGVPGADHVAARLLCRAGDAGEALRFVAALADTTAAADALVHEAPGEWTDALGADLAADDPQRVRVAAHVLGAQRRSAGSALLQALARVTDAETEAALVGALGALRYPPSRTTLARRYADASHGPTSRAAVRARLRLGDLDAAGVLASGTDEAPLTLALCGSERDGAALAAAARAGSPSAALALGVLGDARHVPLLLDLLADAALAAEAALGLRVLTGAPLTGEVVVLDDPTDPELGGDVVVRPSGRAEAWRAWWAAHGEAFAAGMRTRAGRPFDPHVAVTAAVGGLADDLLPAPLREALADELAGRYGLDASFRADAFVAHQRAVLATLAEAALKVRVQEGEWASRPVPGVRGHGTNTW